MSDRRHSRNVETTHLPIIITLADLTAARSVDPTVGARRKQADCSAIRTFCKWMAKEPQSVPAERGPILREMARLNPVLCGVSKGRFRNVLSLVRRLLIAYRGDLIDTRNIALSPAWLALRNAVDDPIFDRALGRFARWCSRMSVSPSQVDQAVADRYAADLAQRMFSTNARDAFTEVCRAWNRAVTRYPQVWPQVRLDLRDQRQIYVLPSQRIDPAFSRDLEAMLARFGSRLDLPKGFTSPYANGTREEMRRVYRRLYSVAVQNHKPAVRIASIADLTQVDVVRSVLEHYLTRFGAENTRSAGKYAHLCYVAAKYWVEAPAEELAKLQTFRRNLTPPAIGMTEKNRAMLRQFEDEGRIDRLLSQGSTALAAFGRLSQPKMSDAYRLQKALAIELLLAAPVRPHNLASIALSRHLVWRREGARDFVHLVFPADEVKNDTDLEFLLPPCLINMLKVYLARARPLITNAGNDFLFPGRGQPHKGRGPLSKQIAATALRALGVRVTAHQFRHLVGFIYLKDNPGGHEVVRRLLGHKDIATTLTFYAGMEQAAAIAHYDGLIEQLRVRAAPPDPKRRKIKALAGRRARGA